MLAGGTDQLDLTRPDHLVGVRTDAEAVESLGLTETQNAALSQKAKAFRDRRRAVNDRLLDLHKRIGLAARAGNLPAARRMAEKLRDFPNPVVEEGLFRLEVLELLTAEQLDYLAENHPVLLSEPWRGGGWPLVRAGKHSRRGPHSHEN